MPQFNQEYQVIRDLKGYMTLEQVDRILKAAANKRDLILLRLLSRTGRRITEIIGRKTYIHRNSRLGIEKEYAAVIGIRPVDINWEEGLIAFPIIKKKVLRRKLKPIDNTTLQMLKEYIIETNIEPTQTIFSLTRAGVFKMMRKCCERAEIYYIGEKQPHPHHFRHTFAIQALKHSHHASDIKKIQMALEHSNLNITSGYLQFSQEELKTLMKDMFEEP